MIVFIVFIIGLFSIEMLSQQINISRVEMMPNHPSPYIMRNWKEVTKGYDSLVFNSQLPGQYLPLISFYSNTVNYPHRSFKLHTVVGTTVPHSGEAINILPAVIGASLVGIDKSRQDGNNYVLMCEEFFNNRPEENVYLNQPVTSSGNDWWYETMPNVFFYQLYDLYPGTGDFDRQFTLVADRWLESVKHMGGSSLPWRVPNMNYRAWDLSSMTPNPNDVKEPEAAGAIGWILYNAFLKTGNEKYRIGAEWCMEFLNNLTSNPSYELQLGYGAFTAARMNAELGTNYNLEKIINWCFNIGPLRKWGTIYGTWNGYDVSGLIGELNDNEYAFLMNTFELAGALVPLVRYDNRFARAIGKWMINAANAARLFYREYLPAENQDSYNWSAQYDPNSYIAHEALRERHNGKSPFATGDAISGGWGLTNLALYGSSHVGIFGGIIDTTEVEKILRLDLKKTDYFTASPYPAYLYYNPYETIKQVTLNAGTGSYDIYDAASNDFIARNISGEVSLSIPADGILMPVIIPLGANVTHSLNHLLVNGVIIDFNTGNPVSNYPPRIKSLAAEVDEIVKEDTLEIYCTAEDNDGDQLEYNWSGTDNTNNNKASFIAPDSEGVYPVVCIVTDGKDTSTATIFIKVVSSINNAPQIISLKSHPRKVDINSSIEIFVEFYDSDDDSLTFQLSSDAGSFSSVGSKWFWHSPGEEGNYYIICSVTDGKSTTKDSIQVIVRNFSLEQTGNLILHLPFNSNANDESGYANSTTIYQASLTPDRFNNQNSAFLFDGNNDYIKVSNAPLLNFDSSISLNFWIIIKSFFEREAYPISHGNWENRWKLSLTDSKLRWTIKTSFGITDLDSETDLKRDSIYNISAQYNGSDMELYINGELDAFKTWSGLINSSPYDLIIGQALPGNSSYGFHGVLDDIRLYDYALSVSDIMSLYNPVTGVHELKFTDSFFLEQNYPNPFNSITTFVYNVRNHGYVSLKLFDILGNEVKTLINEFKSPGRYQIVFDGNGLASGIFFARLQTAGTQMMRKIIYLK